MMMMMMMTCKTPLESSIVVQALSPVALDWSEGKVMNNIGDGDDDGDGDGDGDGDDDGDGDGDNDDDSDSNDHLLPGKHLHSRQSNTARCF